MPKGDFFSGLLVRPRPGASIAIPLYDSKLRYRALRRRVPGADAVPGMVFKARQPTGQLASEWATPEDNLITSRILWLDGLETGYNQGSDADGKIVDTRRRFVYIHGTNQSDKLGRPNSHGCVLLADKDVIRLFDLVAIGTKVLIRS